MKENDFKNILSRLDTDTSMDQQITERLINYEASTANSKKIKLQLNLSAVKFNKSFYKLTKYAALLIFILLGSTTAFAANYILKSYVAKHEFIKLPDSLPVPNREITQYGIGHKNETSIYYDAETKTTEYYGPEDQNEEDIKYGDEAFSALGLPNLIPTYLYDNYLLSDKGYRYIKQLMDDGTTSTEIAADFFTVGSSKHVYVEFFPSEKSMKDTVLYYLDKYFKPGDFNTSNYTTKNGLICNMTEDDNENIIEATILFDSEVLGNVAYSFCFTDVQMEEVKAILESIPLSEVTE